MEISSVLLTQDIQEIADALFRAGRELNGNNLRRSSWREIAEGIQDGRIASILVQRLQAATTREDALRVLRIARKRVRVKKKSAGRKRPSAQPPPILLVETPPQSEIDNLENLEYLWFIEEIENEINPPGDFDEWKLSESDWYEQIGQLNIPGLQPASPLHEFISHYALQRIPKKLHPGAMQNRLDKATYEELVQTFTDKQPIIFSPKTIERVTHQAPSLSPLMSANPLDFSGIPAIQTGYELAIYALLQEEYGISYPVLVSDWAVMANWFIEKFSLKPEQDATELVAGFYFFVHHAPLASLGIIVKASQQFHFYWSPILYYFLLRKDQLFPPQQKAIDQSNRPWQIVTELSLGSYLVLQNLRNALQQLLSLAPDEFAYDLQINLLMCGGGSRQHMNYPAFQVLSRPSISIVTTKAMIEFLEVSSQFNILYRQLQSDPLRAVQDWICTHIQETYHTVLEDGVMAEVMKQIEQIAVGFILLKYRILSTPENAITFRLRRKHIMRFWSDWESGQYRDMNLPIPEFANVRDLFSLDVQIEGLAFALLDQFKEDWASESQRTAVKEGFLQALRSLSVAYHCTLIDWEFTEELRYFRTTDATGVANYLIKQFIHAPLELRQALVLAQELPLLNGAQKTTLERRAHAVLRISAGNSTQHFIDKEGFSYTCRPITKYEAMLRGNLAGDCSTSSVPLRALSPHHTYYGIFKGSTRLRGYITVFEAWAEKTDGERLPVLCLETINLPNGELDGVQQDLLLIFDAIAQQRGLHSPVVLITGIGTWNFQNGSILQYCRRFRQGEAVNLFPADPVSWKIYSTVITQEAGLYSAFSPEKNNHAPTGIFRILDSSNEYDASTPENRAEVERILALPRKQLLVTAYDQEGVTGFISELPEILRTDS